MRDERLDDAFRRDAEAPSVDPALIERISQQIGTSLQPVRPLPPGWVLVSALSLACIGVAAIGAALLGLHGIRNLSGGAIAVILPVLGISIWGAALVSAGEMIPGSRRFLRPWILPVACSLGLAAVFALLFRNYQTTRFVPQGLTCLTAGLAQAIPAAFAGRLILRRGFAVHPHAAALAQGTLAGLAGASMLELHCANFEALHVMTWHTAVVPISAVAGVWLGRVLRRRARVAG